MKHYLDTNWLSGYAKQFIGWFGGNALLMQITGSEVIEVTKVICQALITIATIYFGYLQFKVDKERRNGRR